MYIKAIKIASTLALGMTILTLSGFATSLRVAMLMGLTPLLLTTVIVFLLLGIRFNLNVVKAELLLAVAFVGAFVARATWPGLDSLWNVDTFNAVELATPSMLSFAVFVASLVILAVEMSDRIDQCLPKEAQ